MSESYKLASLSHSPQFPILVVIIEEPKRIVRDEDQDPRDKHSVHLVGCLVPPQLQSTHPQRQSLKEAPNFLVGRGRSLQLLGPGLTHPHFAVSGNSLCLFFIFIKFLASLSALSRLKLAENTIFSILSLNLQILPPKALRSLEIEKLAHIVQKFHIE